MQQVIRRTFDGVYIHREDLGCSHLSSAMRFDSTAAAQSHIMKYMGSPGWYEVVPAINPPKWQRLRWAWE